VLIEGSPNQHTALDHLGVEVETTGEVSTAADRLAELGLFAQVENDTTLLGGPGQGVGPRSGRRAMGGLCRGGGRPEATSIHPVGVSPDGECHCGGPAGANADFV
jgi:hypothetical protein